MLSEGRRADRDHRTGWLHWWYLKLQLCCYVVVTRPEYVQPARQLAPERVPRDYPRDTKP